MDRVVPWNAPCTAVESMVRLRLSALTLKQPRQWGACWVALTLRQALGLDEFWTGWLPASSEGTRWDLLLFVLTAYRLIAPGSEWRLYRAEYGSKIRSCTNMPNAAIASPRSVRCADGN
jgi:hypothetical protein